MLKYLIKALYKYKILSTQIFFCIAAPEINLFLLLILKKTSFHKFLRPEIDISFGLA